MELAQIIHTLYEMLLKTPQHVASFALDDEGDRLALFIVLMEKFMEEVS